jgi:hypothetical protein
MAETVAAPKRTRRAKPAGAAARLAELRKLAATDRERAQREAWSWIQELGAARDGEALGELFGLGKAPPPTLDGPTDGILVTTLINPLVDVPARLITGLWMPWQGKAFDAKAGRGYNRLTESSRWPSKLLWPRYGMRATDDGRAAFEFDTAIEPGRVEPTVDVLKIDYSTVKSNPRLVIRQIRDELVELVPDTYLGRILWRQGEDRYSNIGYFALRQPAVR